MMNQKPEITVFPDNSKAWTHRFENFEATVFVPATKLPEDIINFGYEAPYLLYFAENSVSVNASKEIAEKNGLAKIASEKATSVVFIYPLCEGGWKNAKEELYTELIANSKIHQYHEDGMAKLVNRFTHSADGYAIRGAIFRTYIYANGDAADYVASTLLKPVNGDGLWGPADVCPTAVILENLSVTPKIERRNMPIVSVNNSTEINEVIKKDTDICLFKDSTDFEELYYSFLIKHIRWGWVGDLQESPDFEALGMNEEFCEATVTTSPDDLGDYTGSKEHRIGYISFYNKNLFSKGPAPLVLCFHGGGDSAMHISEVSCWYKVAHDHDFLLVCIEDHLNSTATEMMELLTILKKKYLIDTTRIYATGFSMGGCKSWDHYQEYPEVFAGLAPMDATFDVGLNVFGKPAPKAINQDVLVPIFYVGGEETPLPELPFQADKCLDRMKYVFKVNKVVKEYNAEFDKQDDWENKIWGVNGDRKEVIYDPDRDSDLTIQYYKSEDGNEYTAFASVSKQGHECRYHSCEHAWQFLSKFARVNGKIELN